LLDWREKKMSVLRTLCGRDSPRSQENQDAFLVGTISEGRMQSETEGANLLA
jgi:hypothetical protein